MIRHLQAALMAVLVILLMTGAPIGCGGNKQLNGDDVRNLKIETLKKNQGKLTPTEELRIQSIHANTRNEYEHQVEQIIADRKRKQETQE